MMKLNISDVVDDMAKTSCSWDNYRRCQMLSGYEHTLVVISALNIVVNHSNVNHYTLYCMFYILMCSKLDFFLSKFYSFL